MVDVLSNSRAWNLTEYGQGPAQRRTFNVPLPECVVGRGTTVGFRIDDQSVSKVHARIFSEAGSLFVEDLGSTNGTFVNGQPIQQSAVSPGDLLQFANVLYRVGCDAPVGHDGTQEQGPSAWASTLLLFDRLLNDRAVVPHYQSIIQMNDASLAACEVLARSSLDGLRNPAAMFGAAERLGQQAALSELMREAGAEVAASSETPTTRLFFNIHPVEFGTDRLVNSLHRLRQAHPHLPITIEIHEGAVSEVSAMKTLRDQLTELDMQLSYDDFGAGQGRLVELTEVPPDVLKFDMQLIRGIDSAAASRQELLRSLIRIALDSGSIPLAEGVETEDEHRCCCQLGFTLGQGYLYGRPQPMPPAANP